MRINKNHWLVTKPIAHRGLWGGDIIENSISAYQNAANNGYPIEIDVYITKDNHLVSFHDNTLIRMTGEEGFVYDKTLDELKALRLLNSNEQIPTFDEVLEIAEGKSPLLIEIKNQPNNKVVDAVVERLKTYKGEFAIQSFNPLYVNRVRKLAPEFIRGILTVSTKEAFKTVKVNWVVRKMALNWLIKPDFIAIYHKNLPIKKSKCKNCRVICWTITDQELADKALQHAENIIFENFIPVVK